MAFLSRIGKQQTFFIFVWSTGSNTIYSNILNITMKQLAATSFHFLHFCINHFKQLFDSAAISAFFCINGLCNTSVIKMYYHTMFRFIVASTMQVAESCGLNIGNCNRSVRCTDAQQFSNGICKSGNRETSPGGCSPSKSTWSHLQCKSWLECFTF